METSKKSIYNERYVGAYMAEGTWTGKKKGRIMEIIREQHLPAKGIALDYVCGNGIFTQLLHEALPEWTVYGCDISDVAIENAKAKYPNLSFFVSNGETNLSLKNKFDLVFSHHVLEHVENLEETIDEIDGYLKEKSYMFHVFPCGNEGSFEYNLSTLHRNGINPDIENRFFYEDPEHLRRATTDQMEKLLAKKGFKLVAEYYKNQYYGALSWISNNTPDFINKLTLASNAKGKKEARKIFMIKTKLLTMHFLQRPYRLWVGVKNKPKKKLVHHIFLILGFVPKILSGFFAKRLDRRVEDEWNNGKTMRNGSEMYLFFKRGK